MNKWSVADKIAFAVFILTLLGSVFGFYQYKAIQRKEEITLKVSETELVRYWNAKFDFSMDIPENWILEPQVQARDGFTCTHPTENIEIRAAGEPYDKLDEKENSEIINDNQFPDYDFEHEIKNLENNHKIEILLENRVRKYEQGINGKNITNSDIPAKFIVYKYFNKDKNAFRIKTMLLIAGYPNESDYELVLVKAYIDSSIEFYEANKDIFSRIVLSLNFGRKKL